MECATRRERTRGAIFRGASDDGTRDAIRITAKRAEGDRVGAEHGGRDEEEGANQSRLALDALVSRSRRQPCWRQLRASFVAPGADSSAGAEVWVGREDRQRPRHFMFPARAYAHLTGDRDRLRDILQLAQATLLSAAASRQTRTVRVRCRDFRGNLRKSTMSPVTSSNTSDGTRLRLCYVRARHLW